LKPLTVELPALRFEILEAAHALRISRAHLYKCFYCDRELSEPWESGLGVNRIDEVGTYVTFGRLRAHRVVAAGRNRWRAGSLGLVRLVDGKPPASRRL